MKKIMNIFAMLLVAGLLGACGPFTENPAGEKEINISDIQLVGIENGVATLTVGSTLTITVAITPADAVDQTLSFVSSDDAVATVNAEGLVEAIGKGTATITVVSNADPTITTSFTLSVADEILDISDAIDQSEAEARRK